MIKAFFLITISWLNPVKPADSLRLETINGKTFIIHEVGERETLYGLSRRYGASIPSILENNPSADGGLAIGLIVKIPYAPRANSTTASISNAGTLHRVTTRETLFSISRLYNVTVEEIRLWNNLTGNALSVGQELTIKKSTQSASDIIRPQAAPGKHIVAQGETLFSIARQYKITVGNLKEWNELIGSELNIGEELTIKGSAGSDSSPVSESIAQQPSITENKVVINEPVTTTPSTVGSIQISEAVAGTKEVKESGLAELIDGTEGNRKYMALHRTAPVGTILKVRNELNNREVFVRVIGPLPNTGVNDKLVIKISKSAYDRLGAIDPRFRTEVTYYK